MVKYSRGGIDKFQIQKNVFPLISGVKTRDSCTHIFIEYRILTVALLYILAVLCFIKKFKGNLKHNFHFHGYNTRDKTDLHT